MCVFIAGSMREAVLLLLHLVYYPPTKTVCGFHNLMIVMYSFLIPVFQELSQLYLIYT